MGGDPGQYFSNPFTPVSIHAPAWGATQFVSEVKDSSKVSIHAPAWGATHLGRIQWVLPDVSIHAPAWGATAMSSISIPTRTLFQSTPPHGGRRVAHDDQILEAPVSIHAPAWGATDHRRFTDNQAGSFNPRPRMGGDVRGSATGASISLFQSTPPAWGATLPVLVPHDHQPFQSTPPHGGRLQDLFDYNPMLWFQSTPPHGGRLNPEARAIQSYMFSIHAPAWGATSARHQHPRISTGFNPRPRMGGDTPPLQPFISGQEFQSTPPHGGRRGLYQLVFSGKLVSIHAPAWGATTYSAGQSSEELFQSTPPHGGRPLTSNNQRLLNLFQSTPPHGGRRSNEE